MLKDKTFMVGDIGYFYAFDRILYAPITEISKAQSGEILYLYGTMHLGSYKDYTFSTFAEALEYAVGIITLRLAQGQSGVNKAIKDRDILKELPPISLEEFQLEERKKLDAKT